MPKTLREFPEYAAILNEWHPTLNLPVTPDSLGSRSGKNIWWQCKTNPEHTWQMVLLARTAQGQGCPYCSGRRTDTGRNDLATRFPDIAAEWDYEKNSTNPALAGVTPTSVAAGSNKKVSWIGNDCGHTWEAIIQSRTQGTNKCPYCANRKVLAGFNDLASATQHTTVTAEWHSANELKPTEVMPSSNKKVRWQCSANPEHSWEAMINNRTSKGSGCPHCYREGLRQGETVMLTALPLLAAEYSRTLNDEAPETIATGSDKLVWWECSEDNRHVWQSKVVNRAHKGGGCQVCAGRQLVPGVNDLASNPDYAYLVAEWHTDNPLSPSEVIAGTENKHKWKCTQGHEWEASIYTRVRMNQNCPQCAGRTGDETVMVSEIPALMLEWHPSNTEDPTKIASRGGKKITWQCQLDDRHVWVTTPGQRITAGNGCPVCVGMKVITGVNDLASYPKFKHLLKEWHEDNVLKPTEMTYSSNKVVIWKCSTNKSHVWSAPLSSRTHLSFPTGCPDCAAANRVSKGEQEIADWLTSLGLTVNQSVRGLIGRHELDIFLPDLMVAVEFNGLYWHSTKVRSDPSYHYKKWKACHDLGITLHQVWEDDWYNRKDAVKNTILSMIPGKAIDPEFVEPVLTFKRLEDKSALAFIDEFHLTLDFVEPTRMTFEYWGLTDATGEIQGLYVFSPSGEASHFIVRGSRETLRRLITEAKNQVDKMREVRFITVNLFNEAMVARELSDEGFSAVSVVPATAFLIGNLSRTLRTDANEVEGVVWDAGKRAYAL